MKLQSYILQYIIFFVIGLSLFSTILSFFSSIVSSTGQITKNSVKEVITNNLLINILDIVVGCNYCNYSKTYTYLPTKIQDSFYEIVVDNIDFNNIEFYFRILDYSEKTPINLNNLNYTYQFLLNIDPKNLPKVGIIYFSSNNTLYTIDN